MSVEHWNKIAKLVDAALEQPPDERARYLDEACDENIELRAEIDALLARGEAPSFLDSGALALAAPLLDALHLEADDVADVVVPDEFNAAGGLRYKVEKKIRRGGMATVYLAHDTKHDRRVAVKVLHPDLTIQAERFVQEIRLTARLQHPHVLALLDSGVFASPDNRVAGRPYYVMPFVEGESLRVQLASGHSLGLSEIVRLLREVADALRYAHSQGVIHRDIKPENILMSGGHAVVADFGIAKALFAAHANDAGSGVPGGSFEQLSTRVGTPAYMAPEQADAETVVDHRADLYAWGVVAYEILSGRHPFAASRSAAELLRAHKAEAPRALRDVAPTVSPGLEALVMRCLAKAPADRPGSAAEVVAALDSAAIAAPPDRSPFRGISLGARRGVMAALGTVLVLVTSILYAWFVRAGKSEVVHGTGNPARDVGAVQTAIDRAETVVLDGDFDFRQPPTKPVDPILSSSKPASPPLAQVLISKPVTILGVRDARGGMTTINGGTMPFYVDAPGARVTIRGLRFVRPTGEAIFVKAAHDLDIDMNRIEGLEPFQGAGAAIMINPSGNIPKPSDAGTADDVLGNLTINRNDVDAAGGAGRAYALGVAVFSAGRSPSADLTLDINGNSIRNTTTAITVRRVNGHVRVFDNVVDTGSELVGGDSEAVRLVNIGSYWMANNTVNCRWARCVGIAVFSQHRGWPIHDAIIEKNQVNMLPPPGIVLADSSAGIEIKGFAHSNVVRNNTIHGRARTALAIMTYRDGVPADNAFIDNHVDNFQASLANAFVGSGVLRTLLVRAGTVDDHGVKTRIER